MMVSWSISQAVTMRSKSIEKFKDKIRELTCRSFNLEDDRIMRVNQVIRGTANYFATPFSHNRHLFTEMDKWIRVRLRSMKYNRKWKTDKLTKSVSAFHSFRFSEFLNSFSSLMCYKILSHRMNRTLGQEDITTTEIRQQYKGPIQFAEDSQCFRL